MDKGNFKKLNSYHVVFLIENVMIGMNLLTLPHDLSVAGYNQWWITILLGVIAQLTMLPMYWLCIRYPDEGFFAINEILLGRFLGKIINIVMIVYSILTISAVTNVYIRLVQTVTLPDRAITMPLLFLFVVMIYIVLGGIKSIARFCILGFAFTGWMVYYLQWGLGKGEATHIFPLFTATLPQILQALNHGAPAMFGYELMMVYFPFIKQQKKALKHASIGLWITIFFYLAVSFTSVVYFSPWQLENLVYPVLNLFKAVELSFIERIENFGVALWSFLILTTAAAYLWTAKRGLDSVLLKNRLSHLYIAAAIGFFLIRGPFPIEWQNKMFDEWAVYLGYGMIVWPTFLLAIHWIRKPRGKPA